MVEKLDAMLEQVDWAGVEATDKRDEQFYNVCILAALLWAEQAWDKVMKATVGNY